LCRRYYIVGLEQLLKDYSVKDFYVDVGCQLAAHIRKLVAADQLDTDLRVLVPWFHAKGHNLDCQLEYSGMYQVIRIRGSRAMHSVSYSDGSAINLAGYAKSCGHARVDMPLLGAQEHAARRIGEQTEQLWALLKPLHRSQRYMALCNRQDSLDDAVGYHAEERFWSLPQHMVKLFDNTMKQLGELSALACCTDKLA